MKKNTTLFLETSLYGLGTLMVAVLFWRLELITAAIVASIGVVMIIRGERKDWALYVTCGILGSVAEMIAVYFGVWEYAMPAVFGVPVWLPFVWGNAALYIVRINKVINN